jgi:uncharacterized protein (TIGR02599 family)
MLSTVVLAIMLMLIAQIIGQTQRSWRAASSRLSQFREARIAFDTIARNLRQATLNSYRDYQYESTGKNYPAENTPKEAPKKYVRMSELAFKSGSAGRLVTSLGSVGQPVGHAVFFQAPLGVTDDERYEGLKHLLCARGYFVVFGNNSSYLPDGLAERLRPTDKLRLMEYQPPAERNQIYANPADWIDVGAAGGTDYLRPVSENIAALIVSPRLAGGDELVEFGGQKQSPTVIAPDFSYDSTQFNQALASAGNPQGSQHLLPPVVRITMIALDDSSMGKLLDSGTSDVLSASGASFTSAARYESDLQSLQNYLNNKRLNYRIFEASVVIPASRYSL